MKRARTLGGVAAGLLLAPIMAVHGQADFPATPPPPGPAPQIKVPAAAEKTLANGLRVIVAERRDLPLVTAELTILVGSEIDPPGRAGAAALLAELLPQGTARQTASEIAAAAAALGGTLDAAAGWDESGIGMTVTTPRLPAALALIAEVARHPAFAADELERARRKFEDAQLLTLRDPGELADLALRRAVFGSAAYGHAPDGTPASLAAIGPADLRALHRRWYRPDNAVLVLAGDLAAADGFALAERAFGAWPRPPARLARPATGKPDPALPALVVINLPDAGQAGVAAGQLTVPRAAADYYPALVTNAVLGGSYSARLSEEIRIRRGLSYGAYSSLDALRRTGWIQASVQTKNPSAAEVVDLVRAQFASLAAAPPAAEELMARQATLIGAFARSLGTTGGLARAFTARAIYGVPLTQLQEHIVRIAAVDGAAVRDFARRHLPPEALHVVVVGDAAVFGAALRAAWPDAAFIEADALDLDRADLGASAAENG